MKYYYTRKKVSEWIKENKILNHKEIDEVLLKVKKGKWTPRFKEAYFFVDSGGEILQTINHHLVDDGWRGSVGNCFKTVKEAEVYKQKLIDLGKEK